VRRGGDERSEDSQNATVFWALKAGRSPENRLGEIRVNLSVRGNNLVLQWVPNSAGTMSNFQCLTSFHPVPFERVYRRLQFALILDEIC